MKNGKVAHLKMLGVTSPSEAQMIETGLHQIDGVRRVSVNLLKEKATVEYDPTKVVIETLIESMEDLGFGALDLAKIQNNAQKYSFRIIGTYVNCLETFVNILMEKDGIIDAKVNLDTKRLQVIFNDKKISIEEIKNSFFDFENQPVY
jgi:Cu+-exporting ATPase